MARVARDDATVLFDIVESLLREKMYHSAEIVGTFLLSKSSVSQIGGLHAEALSMFADALKGRGEHKRATVRYWTLNSTPSMIAISHSLARPPQRKGNGLYLHINTSFKQATLRNMWICSNVSYEQ